MSENIPVLKSMRESAGIRLAVLFGSFFVMLLITSVVSIVITSADAGSARTHTLLTSIVQCILAFCIPAYLLARFSSNDWTKWLHLNRIPEFKAILGVLVVYVVSLPAMEWLIAWNNELHLPESLSQLENVLREWEKSGEETTKILLDTSGFLPVLAGVLVVGLLTGFSEEFFFRGGLQGIFLRSNIGVASSVWLAAIIFSAMHFQFFGFLPRLLMGAFFGYLLVWTKSIWVPVFAHVLNNSAVVITGALTANPSGNLTTNETSSYFLGHTATVVASFTLTALFLILCRNYIFKTKTESWQKSQLPPAIGR